MVNHRLTPAGEISDIVATVDCSDRYYAANAASAARPLVPLFPAAATTVTPAATTLLTAVVKVGKTLSQFGCVPPPSTGDVSRRILMIWGVVVCLCPLDPCYDLRYVSGTRAIENLVTHQRQAGRNAFRRRVYSRSHRDSCHVRSMTIIILACCGPTDLSMTGNYSAGKLRVGRRNSRVQDSKANPGTRVAFRPDHGPDLV